MTALLSVIQWLNVIVLTAILVMAAALYRKWYETRYLMIPVALWSGYGIVFYTLVFLDYLTGTPAELWSAIHRMLAGAMVFGGLVTLWAILDEDDYHGDDDEF